MRKNDGFTLVELMVTFAVGMVVTLAATTVLLLGLRFNAISSGGAQRQNTTRILMTVMENLASEGTIKGVNSAPGVWQVLGEGDNILLSYEDATRTIYTGGKTTKSPLLEDVILSHISLYENGIMTVYVETEDGSYTSSIYCRMLAVEEKNDIDTSADVVVDNLVDEEKPDYTVDGTGSGNEATARSAFLRKLTSQYRMANGDPNPGIIVGGESNGTYYARWYEPSWSTDTPWCACYISWGLYEVMGSNAPKFANVDNFMAYFDDSAWLAGGSIPTPGDIVFFDWSGGDNPAHVGAVLLVNNGYIYTIEGNSAGVVALRKYSVNDTRIIGYGVLDWAGTA